MKCTDMVVLTRVCQWVRKQFHTGSRVIGGWTDESDFDYVATQEAVQAMARQYGIDGSLADATRYGEHGSVSFKYRTPEDAAMVNLIVVPDKRELEAWIFATKKSKTLSNRHLNLTKKETRVSLFEALKDVYRDTHPKGDSE